MGEPSVNGDMPHSATLDHVTKYPVVSDSISAFQSNPYGQKSIDITNFAYARFVKPTFPYLEKPAAYAKPYVAKADEIGNNILSKIDERVPIVKSETSDIKKTVVDYAHWPIKVANDQKDYVIGTYSDEYKKAGGDGVVAGSKALVSGSFLITSDWLSYFASLLQKGKQEAKSKASEAKSQAQDGAEAAKEKTNEKTNN
ncbi:hypothetical protein OHC33_007203 [Knufia fluminis]|uniref:Uncharacterized protein n=1 Tax=Knufia fluminis TaxID=191047 RepID=A0AAN8EDX3_9EURO|nr:hypothetical protein OHC33_007203 [Knufia fluminis]